MHEALLASKKSVLSLRSTNCDLDTLVFFFGISFFADATDEDGNDHWRRIVCSLRISQVEILNHLFAS